MITLAELHMWKYTHMSGDILIIDDTYQEIQTLDSILREAGYSVRAARDGKSGIRAASSVIPDLILLDVVLPDLDGFEICEQFRSDKRLANVPIIFLSALHDVDLKARAFEVGGSDYITKPFNSMEVLVRVRHQLERIHLWAELQENARLDEREHIARELHDSVNQTLFILRATVQSMLIDADGLPAELHKQLENANTLSKSALAEMRALLNELHPAQIRTASIQKLLHLLVDAFRLRLNAEIDVVIVDGDLPHAVKLAFYRIAQEAINNVAKYASTNQLSVKFLDEGNQYRLLIEDNGGGFDWANVTSGMGLHTMRERAEQNGMDLHIHTEPGQGTRVDAVWRYGR